MPQKTFQVRLGLPASPSKSFHPTGGASEVTHEPGDLNDFSIGSVPVGGLH
jgi:hypothetical protein